MSDPILPIDGWTVAGALWKVVLTILGWIGLQQKRRIDSLETAMQGKAAVADTAKETDRIEQAFREYRKETHEAFQQINARLDKIFERMAR